MDNFLKYGDLVVLYQGPAGVQTHKRPPSASAMNDPEEEVPMNVTGNQTSLAALPPNGLLGPHGGLLSATGYADSGIYMQELIRPWVGDETGRVSEANIIGLGEAVFTITPKLNFDFHKDYKKTLSYFRALESSLTSSQSPEARQEQLKLRDNLFSKLQKLEERTRKEELLNASIVKEATGKPVTYGSDIQLMHYDSASFIKAANDCSQAESIGYMCGLSTFYSSGMVFKVLPRYRSRQDGEAIQLRDNIILQNVKHKAYLTLSKEIPVLLDLENPPDQNPFLANTCVYDTRAKRFHVFLSQDSETSFQVLLYRGHTADSNNYLLGGDMIQMIHTETQGEVTAMISQRGRTDVEVFLRKYQGDYPEEEHSAFSYWFIEHPAFEKAGERFSVKSPSGGRNRTSNGIRLRHMISSKSIEKSVKKAERQEATSVARGIHDRHTVSQDKRSAEVVQEYNLILKESLDAWDRYCLFDFEPVVKNSEHLLNNQIFFITESDSRFYLKSDKEVVLERKNNELLDILRNKDLTYKFYPLEPSDIGDNCTGVKVAREFSSEDAFIVQKIPEQEKKDILFIRSVVPQLKYMRKVFVKGRDEASVENEIFHNIIKVLQNTITFLFGLDSTIDHDYFEIEGMPSCSRQRLLKDLGVIDGLISLIYLPFRSGMYSFKKIDLSKPYAQMLTYTYTSIRYAIKEYRPSELYASQWLYLIMDQSLETTGNNDIKAGQTLTELIDNNQRILESRIEQQTILRFIQILRDKDKDAKYVDILRAICICDGQPMIKNQKDIAKEMLEHGPSKEKLVFKIKNDSVRGVVIGLDIDKYEDIGLVELETESKERDDGKVYEYVVSMVRLLSDLCKDRNYLSIDVLQKEFTYDICYEVISGGSHSYKIREAFASFMLNLWIDVSPLQRKSFPNFVRLWGGNDDRDAHPRNSSTQQTGSFVMNHEKLKGFLFEYLKNLKDSRKLKDPEVLEQKYSFDLVVLELTQ